MDREEIIPFPKEVMPSKQSMPQRVFAVFYQENRPLSEFELISIMKTSGGNLSRIIRDLVNSGILEKMTCPTCKTHTVYQLKKNGKNKRSK